MVTGIGFPLLSTLIHIKSGDNFFHISLKYTLRKQAFYYNIYKDIYVFFKNTVRVCGKLNIINTHLI